MHTTPFCCLFQTPLRCLVALCLFSVALPLAAEPEPRALMAQGVEAHETGDTDKAIALLEQARAAGLDSDSLHYNLGVAYYRAGQLEEARASFKRLLEAPELADLARYNLGLVALAADQPDRAEALFRQVHQGGEKERLRVLAGRQLGRLEVDDNNPPWLSGGQGGLSLAGGYEDNVALSSQSRLEEGDVFAELLGYGSGYLAGNANGGWRLSGVFAHRQFRRSPEIRQNLIRLGLARDQRLADWALRLGGEVDHARLGGEHQDSRFRVRGRAQRSLGEGRWRLQGAATRIRAGSSLPEYEGYEWGAESDYRLPVGELASVGLGYRFELNDREDLQLEQDFFSTSPRRHRLRFRMDFPLGPYWQLYNTLDYRLSRYADPEQRNGETLRRRHEEQWLLRSRLERALSSGVLLFVSAEWERNQSNLNDRDYRRMEWMTGLEWRY